MLILLVHALTAARTPRSTVMGERASLAHRFYSCARTRTPCTRSTVMSELTKAIPQLRKSGVTRAKVINTAVDYVHSIKEGNDKLESVVQNVWWGFFAASLQCAKPHISSLRVPYVSIPLASPGGSKCGCTPIPPSESPPVLATNGLRLVGTS